MFIYIAALALIITGASAGIILALQALVREGRLAGYDARGYLVVAILLLTFLVGGLAYFWGVSRFGVPRTDAETANGAVLGLLFTVFGCIGALGYGLTRLKTPLHRQSAGPMEKP